jgi:hypothetical protein
MASIGSFSGWNYGFIGEEEIRTIKHKKGIKHL